jgi:hypothetical protein
MFGLSTGVMAYNRTARRRQQIRWYYDRNDPTAVTFSVPALNGTNEWAEWAISRDALGDAYLHPVGPVVGYGVRMHLRGERLIITVRGVYFDDDNRPVDCETTLSLPAGPVWEFLLSTHKVVPPCSDAGRCEGIARDDCLECTLLSAGLDATLVSLLADDSPFAS